MTNHAYISANASLCSANSVFTSEQYKGKEESTHTWSK